jgi:hypothetical protein
VYEHISFLQNLEPTACFIFTSPNYFPPQLFSYLKSNSSRPSIWASISFFSLFVEKTSPAGLYMGLYFVEDTKFWGRASKCGGPLSTPDVWAPLLFSRFLLSLLRSLPAAPSVLCAIRRRPRPASPSPDFIGRRRGRPRHGRIRPFGGRAADLRAPTSRAADQA